MDLNPAYFTVPIDDSASYSSTPDQAEMWALWDELYLNTGEVEQYEDPYLIWRLALFILIALLLIYLVYKIS